VLINIPCLALFGLERETRNRVGCYESRSVTPNMERIVNMILYRPCIVINCIKSPRICTFSYVFILKFNSYMFRTDTPFIIRSLRVPVHTPYERPLARDVQTAVYTVICKLLMMNCVSVRYMYSANFRINTYEKVHLVGLFIQPR
jgi:hypothetical protein